MNRHFGTWLGILTMIALVVSPSAAAQQVGEIAVGGGAGISYYCIVTRCDAGTTLRLTAGYSPSTWLGFDAGFRLHDCFDCHRFRIYEGGVRLRYSASAVQPFVVAGIHRSTDAEFMGTRTGSHAAIGLSFGRGSLGMEVELLGRSLGSGDRMGEATLAVVYRGAP